MRLDQIKNITNMSYTRTVRTRAKPLMTIQSRLCCTRNWVKHSQTWLQLQQWHETILMCNEWFFYPLSRRSNSCDRDDVVRLNYNNNNNNVEVAVDSNVIVGKCCCILGYMISLGVIDGKPTVGVSEMLQVHTDYTPSDCLSVGFSVPNNFI